MENIREILEKAVTKLEREENKTHNTRMVNVYLHQALGEIRKTNPYLFRKNGDKITELNPMN